LHVIKKEEVKIKNYELRSKGKEWKMEEVLNFKMGQDNLSGI
jgi:hypothetical protein